jgi:hypothetical protein
LQKVVFARQPQNAFWKSKSPPQLCAMCFVPIGCCQLCVTKWTNRNATTDTHNYTHTKHETASLYSTSLVVIF